MHQADLSCRREEGSLFPHRKSCVLPVKCSSAANIAMRGAKEWRSGGRKEDRESGLRRCISLPCLLLRLSSINLLI